MMPLGAAIRLMTTWSPTAMPVTIMATSTTSPCRFVAERHATVVAGQAAHRDEKARPYRRFRTRIMTSASAGPLPGFGASTTCVSPNAVWNTFIDCSLSGKLVKAGDKRRDVARDDVGERAVAETRLRPSAVRLH